jgi:hypothetical protein
MTTSKYNPNKFGRANRPHHNPKYIMPDGTYLLYGNGCSKGGNDCFNCPLQDCYYDEKEAVNVVFNWGI